MNDRLNALKRSWKSEGAPGPGTDVVHLVPPELLQKPPFGPYAAAPPQGPLRTRMRSTPPPPPPHLTRYLIASNDKLGALQAKALRRLVAMYRNPGERVGDHGATRDACLRAWRLPAETPPPNEYGTVEDFYNYEIVGSQAEDMPRLATVELVRHRDFDVESSLAKLRRVDDWVVVEASSDSPPVLMIGADGDGRRGLAFTWDCVGQFWQLRGETKLPRGTLLLVELVAEQTERGEFYEVAHAIDAGMLGGQDVRRLPYAERRRRLELMLQALRIDEAALPQQGYGGPGGPGGPPMRGPGAPAPRHVPVRLKPAWSLRELPAALDAADARVGSGGPQWRHRGVLLFPGHNVTVPVQPGPPQWTKHFSNSMRAEYWFNKADGRKMWVAELEKQTAKPISFRSCAATLSRWDRQKVLEGGMEERTLRELAANLCDVADQRAARAKAAQAAAATGGGGGNSDFDGVTF